MPKFVVERMIPEAGNLSAQELCAIATQISHGLQELTPDIQWVESFVTDHRIYCIYIASDEQRIHEHARRTGFPIDRVCRVRAMMDPTTGGAG